MTVHVASVGSVHGGARAAARTDASADASGSEADPFAALLALCADEELLAPDAQAEASGPAIVPQAVADAPPDANLPPGGLPVAGQPLLLQGLRSDGTVAPSGAMAAATAAPASVSVDMAPAPTAASGAQPTAAPPSRPAPPLPHADPAAAPARPGSAESALAPAWAHPVSPPAASSAAGPVPAVTTTATAAVPDPRARDAAMQALRELRTDAHPSQPVAADAALPAMVQGLASPRPGPRTELSFTPAWPTAGADLLNAPSTPMPTDLAAAATAPPLGTSEALLNQVSWWLSQRTQGAELTIDAGGAGPVSVSVQVQGNEAQVVFRSDQAEARQALGNALPQLRDMLGQEGLMLAGAFVSTSGGNPGAQEQPVATRVPPPSPESDPVAQVAAASGGLRAHGRALDLYV